LSTERGAVNIMKIRANDYDEKTVMKLLREWTEKNQEEFGRDIGLSKMTIQGYERGERRYTFETLMRIAKRNGYIVTIEKKARQ
jgi:transcriptional regulator with XRE-family HTH domain